MRILLLSNIDAGGEWIATQTLIEKLSKKDESLRFYLIASSKNKHLLKESLFEEIIFLMEKNYSKPFKYYRKLFYQLSSGKKAISNICKQYKFDCVIATNNILAISYIVSQKKSNYIYFFHGIMNNYKIFSDTFNHYLIFQKLLEILAWAMCKKLIIPSINAKNVLIEHSFSLLKKKLPIVFPNLIRDEFKNKFFQSELDEFKKNLNIQGKKIILYSGRLASDKGIEKLIHTFLLITKKYPRLVMVILYLNKPDIEYFKKIKAIIEKGAKIILIHNPPTQELSILYQISILAVLPSLFEISSLFPREALMCNLPIITTNTGDADKILSSFFILKDNKINTIYSKINIFLNNESKYKKKFLMLTKNFKSKYNEEQIINGWIKVLKTYNK